MTPWLVCATDVIISLQSNSRSVKVHPGMQSTRVGLVWVLCLLFLAADSWELIFIF